MNSLDLSSNWNERYEFGASYAHLTRGGEREFRHLGTYLLTASYQCSVSQLCPVGADIGLDLKVECGVLQGFIFATFGVSMAEVRSYPELLIYIFSAET